VDRDFDVVPVSLIDNSGDLVIGKRSARHPKSSRRF
jgi:hypothetical protein